MLIGNIKGKVKESNHLVTLIQCDDKCISEFFITIPSTHDLTELEDGINDLGFEERVRFNPRKDKYFKIGDFKCKLIKLNKLTGIGYLKGKKKEFGRILLQVTREGLCHCPRISKEEYKNELEDWR